MTQEDKNLLLKDLYARLPYGVKYMRYAWNFEWDQERPLIETLEYLDKDGFIFPTRVYNVSDIKPYLRPMSSMTEEEENELVKAAVVGGYNDDSVLNSYIITDWLNAHHFDYRGMIPMGLALEAPEGMYKIK